MKDAASEVENYKKSGFRTTLSQTADAWRAIQILYEREKLCKAQNSDTQTSAKSAVLKPPLLRDGGHMHEIPEKLQVEFEHYDRVVFPAGSYGIFATKANIDHGKTKIRKNTISHAYTVKFPKNKNGKIKIYNPYNSSREIEIDKSTFDAIQQETIIIQKDNLA